MSGFPTHILYLSPRTHDQDKAKAPDDGTGDVYVIRGFRRDIAGRRDATGEILADSVTTVFRVPKAGIEDATPDWSIRTEEGEYFQIESILQDRQYPITYWELRCRNSRANRSQTRFR